MLKRFSLLGFLSTVILLYSQASSDFPRPWQMDFQKPATPVMERIYDLHHHILIVITVIACLVGGLLLYSIWRFRASRNPVPSTRSHHITLEIMWTAIPAIILAIIAYPSLKLLYYMDKAQDATVTVKVTGHQWYWEYDYPDHNINFNSYMLPAEKLKPGDIRLLAVDEEVVVPVKTNVRILLTSADVLHSWSVSSFGVKHDTVPGRLSETWLNVNKPGKYYGQCSELCGSGHGFMSIVVRAVTMPEYQAWLASKKPPTLAVPVKPSVDSTQLSVNNPVSTQSPNIQPAQVPAPAVNTPASHAAAGKKVEVPGAQEKTTSDMGNESPDTKDNGKSSVFTTNPAANTLAPASSGPAQTDESYNKQSSQHLAASSSAPKIKENTPSKNKN